MRDFEKIDWKRFNKPPFYQQWMCRDDTLKLATIGDKGLAEVDEHILSLKDQWDLDHVGEHFLDRIGKLLSEQRNGTSDDHYRIILNLRKLLNTNAGSIPDIIKAIKYLYSSEVVHIVPDYPAGLIIEHDGEGTPGLNFNRLLAEIIPAGVSFSTKELFIFTEEITVDDELEIIVRRITADSFNNGLKYNGRGKYDGYTLNDTEIVNLKHSGTYKYNAAIQYSKTRETEAGSYVAVPFKYSNGIKDAFTARSVNNTSDTVAAADSLQGGIKTALTENAAIAENLAAKINKPFDENLISVSEILSVGVGGYTASDTVAAAEVFLVSKRFVPKHNGAYKYNGAIPYGNALIPL